MSVVKTEMGENPRMVFRIEVDSVDAKSVG